MNFLNRAGDFIWEILSKSSNFFISGLDWISDFLDNPKIVGLELIVYIILFGMIFYVITIINDSLGSNRHKGGVIGLMGVALTFLIVYFSIEYPEHELASLYNGLLHSKDNTWMALSTGVISTLVLLRLEQEEVPLFLFFEVFTISMITSPVVLIPLTDSASLIACISKLFSLGIFLSLREH